MKQILSVTRSDATWNSLRGQVGGLIGLQSFGTAFSVTQVLIEADTLQVCAWTKSVFFELHECSKRRKSSLLAQASPRWLAKNRDTQASGPGCKKEQADLDSAETRLNVKSLLKNRIPLIVHSHTQNQHLLLYQSATSQERSHSFTVTSRCESEAWPWPSCGRGHVVLVVRTSRSDG